MAQLVGRVDGGFFVEGRTTEVGPSSFVDFVKCRNFVFSISGWLFSTVGLSCCQTSPEYILAR